MAPASTKKHGRLGGSREKAAKILGIGEHTLYRKIEEYNLTLCGQTRAVIHNFALFTFHFELFQAPAIGRMLLPVACAIP